MNENNGPTPPDDGKPDEAPPLSTEQTGTPTSLNIQCGVFPEPPEAGGHKVILQFGQAVAYLKLHPRYARQVAVGLLQAADLAEHPPEDAPLIHLPGPQRR